jgi:hypothetical protein
MSWWSWSEVEVLLTLMIYCDITGNHSSHDVLMCKCGALARRNMRIWAQHFLNRHDRSASVDCLVSIA